MKTELMAPEQIPAPPHRTTETSTSKPPSRTLGMLAVLASVMLWGPTFVASKLAMREVGPFMLAFIRFVLATVFMGTLAVVTQLRNPYKKKLPMGRLAAMGLLGGALHFSFENTGLWYVSALEAALVTAMLPAVAAVTAWILIREKLRPVQIGGIVLAVLGVVFVILAGADTRGATFNLFGYFLLIGSSVAWSVYSIISSKLDPEIPSALVAAYNVVFGAIFLLPTAAIDVVRNGGFHMPSPFAWLMIVFLGLGGSGITYLLWNFGLKSLSTGEANVFTNLIPFIGAVCAWFFLKEPLTWTHLWGGLTVAAGVVLVTRQQKRVD
jgi:drug/metabolite transporter (DMT)-like permease